MSECTLASASVAGTALDRYFHICAFFDSRDQEYGVLGSYYTDGLAAGEKALHIVDAKVREEHRTRLSTMGVDVGACEARGQLEVVTPEDTYLAGGSFDPDKMLVTVDAVIAGAKEKGFPRTRIMGNMGWALDDGPTSARLIEYETRVNEVLSRTRQPAICVYDTARLSGAMMLDILRSHPLTLVNGAVHENPFFTPPEVFLAELQKRSRTTRASVQ